jgi:hypothetical protein
MVNSKRYHPDEARSRLRTLAAAVEAEIGARTRSVPPADGGKPADALRSSWEALVAQLALGPEPVLRECPHCHQRGMRDATVCGFCWTTLTPPVDPPGKPEGASA